MKRASKRTDTKKVVEVPASELKNSWHKYLERVTRGREEIVLTRYGKPIARLIPAEEAGGQTAFGWLRGTVTASDDLVEPTGVVWDADV